MSIGRRRKGGEADPTEPGLFGDSVPRPLADRLRPDRLDDVVGQEHLLKPEGAIGQMVSGRAASSIILWGPPGTGKTTIARLLAEGSRHEFVALSAIFSGVAELRKVFEAARERRRDGRATLLFVDEIHRFNRSQQDAFLPLMEDGTIVLVGATTENPSFELNPALLSRSRVLVLNRLDATALSTLMARAESTAGRPLPVTPDARDAMIAMADGDGRYLLTLCEDALRYEGEAPMTPAVLAERLQRRAPVYDKGQEGHFNLISALHKSLRGSDVDAALYWMARMLAGGEDALYLARRLIRFAAEDIGMADPQALVQAMTACDGFERLGSPEGELLIAQAVVYLATAPKSNAQYAAFKAAMSDARETGSLQPPAHILNAPTRLMKDLGYGKGYQYDHDMPDGFSGQNYFPDGMGRRRYYTPPERGFEREILKRLEYWAKRRQATDPESGQ
ncbi:replication-associated recombination protein A [Fodinicurvata sp. EGI_FJ10296]|uniref:replication-associated recombination protein A n=1 Tax=Fodinicurvata sp. EGI_FJ10296 TaxID=3231908 RepID=UPI0034518175